MKVLYLTVLSIWVFTQDSLATITDKEIVDKINTGASGSIAQRCGPLMELAAEDQGALERIITIEAKSLVNENAKPLEKRRFGMSIEVPQLPPEEEILEISSSCPEFQNKYKYMISAKQHKHTSDQTKNVNDGVQKKIQSLEDQVRILEGRVDSLTKAMKR